MSKAKLTRVSSVGLILNEKKDKILLCRLSSIVEKYAGCYTLPGGGIDYGEDPKAALIREVKEETNLQAEISALLDVNSTVLEFSDRISHAIRIIYSATVLPGEIIVEKDGSTDAVGWFSREEVKGLKLTSLSERGIELWDLYLEEEDFPIPFYDDFGNG